MGDEVGDDVVVYVVFAVGVVVVVCYGVDECVCGEDVVVY